MLQLLLNALLFSVWHIGYILGGVDGALRGTVICKNCKVARLVQKSPKPVGDLGERDQLTRRGFSSEGLGFGWGWENGCIRTPTCRKVKGVGINQKNRSNDKLNSF